ncbi:hypothetical protein L9F63_020499 [Diploptera punctata]|uniref:Uncharacterized protein n=1 Tax=Diploptera punctata TaxID=6984 RepID=A0AAD7ZTM1_DIPPU|nr:hypothetical protein L9F63_020499 [Diploptera punctata]
MILPFNTFEELLKKGTYRLHLLSGVELSYFKVLNIVHPRMAEWLVFQYELTPLEEMFDDLYIPLDSEFLVAQSLQDGVIQIKEIYHIFEKSPLEILYVGTWTPNKGLEWKTSGFYKRRKDLHGLVLKVVVTKTDLPTTLIRDNDGNVTEVDGFFGQIWAELQNRLNFSSRYVEIVKKKIGGMSYNGTAIGMIGIIARKEADVAIGGFTIYPSRLLVVDFLIPLLEDHTNLYIREIETLELHWSSFLSPFKKQLWYAVVAALFILSCVFMYSNYMRRRNNTCNPIDNLIESFYCIYGAFCGQGRERPPTFWPCRIVLLTAFLIGYVVVAAYSAALISFLTVQRSELPFTSFRGLLRDGTYKLGVTVGAEVSYFSESKNYIMRRLYAKLIAPRKDHFHENAIDGFMRVCGEDKYALVTSDIGMLRLQSGDVPCNIQKVPHTNIPGSVSIAITKGSPYRALFNYK